MQMRLWLARKILLNLAVKAVDDKTFEVTLTTDLPYFDELCVFPAMMPVRQDIIEENGDPVDI